MNELANFRARGQLQLNKPRAKARVRIHAKLFRGRAAPNNFAASVAGALYDFVDLLLRYLAHSDQFWKWNSAHCRDIYIYIYSFCYRPMVTISKSTTWSETVLCLRRLLGNISANTNSSCQPHLCKTWLEAPWHHHGPPSPWPGRPPQTPAAVRQRKI